MKVSLVKYSGNNTYDKKYELDGKIYAYLRIGKTQFHILQTMAQEMELLI